MTQGRATEEPPEIITDQHRIISVLQRIHKKRGVLSVSIQAPDTTIAPDRGDSLIVEVDPVKRYILLNKLRPEQVHKRFLKIRKLRAKSFIEGIEVVFNGNLGSLIEEGEDSYYRLKIPEKLLYYQKRGAHRANTSHIDPITVTLQLDDGSELSGIIEDISSGGLAIVFSSNLPQTLQIDTTISGCCFDIPDSGKINCELNIRFIQHDYEKSLPKIGARFEQLEHTVRRKISHFVMALEREKRRLSIS